MIPYGRQEITNSDIKEVEKVLRSDFLTQGPVVPKFEKSVANSIASLSVGKMIIFLLVLLLKANKGTRDSLDVLNDSKSIN